LKALHARHPGVAFDAASELAFLGWGEGIIPPSLRALFDDFCDSSTMGMRKPDPGIYLLACSRNNVKPHECVFLDDLGMNLKTARDLGMETIHVPIGGILGALSRLEDVLGIDLTTTNANASTSGTGPEARNRTSAITKSTSSKSDNGGVGEPAPLPKNKL